MLDYYSHSIAVENATYSAKIKAKYISRFNNEQGAVGKELENIFK
jgi:hydroxymethylpyrimidine pyrophosphatase-like HAD family hydrolase